MIKLAAPQTGSPTMFVRDLCALYLRHSMATGLHCQQALNERERILGLFLDHLEGIGVTCVTELRAYHLTDWIEGKEKWKSVSTRRTKASMVKACLQWATDGERISRNPFKNVEYEQSERRPDLPDDCLAQLQHLANKKYELALRFLRLTGCRIGELCEAKWEDVDLERGVWTISKHKSRKKTKKAKLIALVPDACHLLLSVARTLTQGVLAIPVGKEVAGQTDPDFIFLNNRGTKWNDVALGQHLNRMKRKHGLTFKASLHGIRHRFGSAAVAAGAPIKLVSQQLGHSSVVMTEKFYCDLSGEIDSIRAAIQLGLPKS